MKKYTIILIAAALLVGGGYFFGGLSDEKDPQPAVETIISQPAPAPENRPVGQTAPKTPPASVPLTEKIQQAVPFLVQAPLGNWSDPVFQNACEEASMIMAMGWVDGVAAISPESGRRSILDIAAFENKAFGYDADTDIRDMAVIFREYFKHDDISIKEDITKVDIKDGLRGGRLVLVPLFGQALGNPNYTAPGPVAHMLVVTGYDPATREFITNDPGTRHGGGWRYDENILFDAIWEYPSGPSAPAAPSGERKKVMLTVGRQ